MQLINKKATVGAYCIRPELRGFAMLWRWFAMLWRWFAMLWRRFVMWLVRWSKGRMQYAPTYILYAINKQHTPFI